MTLAFTPVARAAKETTVEAEPAAGRPKGLHLTASVLAAPSGSWRPSGFLLGWGVERPLPGDADLDVGMSYLRLTGFGEPVTMVSLLDLTVEQQSATAFIFGSGFGIITAQGQQRAGGRLWLGVEFFHRSALPLALTVDLMFKICDGEQHLCPEQEQETWVAGRLGIRF